MQVVTALFYTAQRILYSTEKNTKALTEFKRFENSKIVAKPQENLNKNGNDPSFLEYKKSSEPTTLKLEFGGRKDAVGSAPASLLQSGERKSRSQSFARPSLAKQREPRGSSVTGRMDSSRGEPVGRPDSARPAEPTTEFLCRQNSDLRRRLDDERDAYRRRIDEYKNKQQQQADLVAKLQSKLVQYKKRCSRLEEQLEEPDPSGRGEARDTALASLTRPSPALEAAQQHLRELSNREICDLDTALTKLADERLKSEKLIQVNNTLRRQLDEALENNEALTTDLHKLSLDFGALQEEMLAKEEEWKDEEQYFNDYYAYEHGRLMSLWRGVVELKRQFTETQSSTQRDLARMKTDFSAAARDLADVAASVEKRQTFSSITEEQAKQSAINEAANLRDILAGLKADHDSAQMQLRAKDDRIDQLTREIQQLEERCSNAEAGISDMGRMQSELEMLQNTLREVAHTVLQDAETTDLSHVHLTPAQPLPPRSPKRAPGVARAPISSAFAESTISAVQASLHKYQLMIHEVQVKLESHKEQLGTMKRHLDSSDETRKHLEAKVSELTSQLDQAKSQASQLSQERETLLKSLESVRAERKAIDNSRLEISAMLESVNSDLEKAQKLNLKLQKQNESFQDDKIFLANEVDRLNKEADLSASLCLYCERMIESFPYPVENSSLISYTFPDSLNSNWSCSGQFYSFQEINLRGEEERTSRLKEELLNTKEELHKTYLVKELLEQQKAEADSLLSQMDKSRGDVESEMELLHSEKGELQDALSKTEVLLGQSEMDKRKLQEEVRKLEEMRAYLQNQVQDQSNDMGSLRKEILQAEQIRLDLESEKLSYQEKCKFLEIEKEKLEAELSQIVRERNELSTQLASGSKKREGLNEELSRIKQRLEQANETNARINRNLEDLVKDAEDKQLALEGNEKEIQRLQEQLASLRAEKEALEATLFDVQTSLEACDNRRINVEKDYNDLLVAQESLKGELSRLKTEMENAEHRSQDMKTSLKQQMIQADSEFRHNIAAMKKKHEEVLQKLSDEKHENARQFIQELCEVKEVFINRINGSLPTKEQQRRSLEKKLETTVSSLSGEKEAEVRALEERIAALQRQIETVCQQHEEVLLRAEQEKQQALLIAHHDQQAVQDKLEEARRNFEGASAALERAKREAAARADQDRVTNNQLRDATAALQSKLDHLRIKAEEERVMLETKLVELVKERDSEVQACEETKLQLSLAEDRIDSLQSQLTDTLHRLKETENCRDTAMKELVDTKRQLADVSFEKDKYNATNKELREHVKRTESQKREQARTLEEALQKISMLEDNRGSMDSERGRLVTLVRELERTLVEKKHEIASLTEDVGRLKGTLEMKGTEEKQLEAKLEAQAEERDRARQHTQQLNKQVLELESALEMAKQEMLKNRSRSEEENRRWESRQQELLIRLEECRATERKLQDEAHNLEVCLADATQQIHELKARLGGSEGRVRALESQLALTEAAKRDTEQKLSSVGSILRRIAGIQLDGSVNTTYKLLSPTRRWSPQRSGGPESETSRHEARHDTNLDVDPEAVRKGVRSLMHQVARIERERDDLRAALSEARRQARETADSAKRAEAKAAMLGGALRRLEEEKAAAEARANARAAEHSAQTEALTAKEEEASRLSEKLSSLELQAAASSDERAKLDDRLERTKQALIKAEAEKRALQDEMSRVESRATKLELQRVAMDGDIQRLQMMLQDKDSTIQKLQDRLETEKATVAGLEQRCASLKSTMEDLSSTLERASKTEQELRNEVNSLQRTLDDTANSSQANADKIRQLQKALSNADNERRVVTERFEAAQHTLAEVRRNYQVLKEAHSKLQAELAASEVDRSGLEAQLRTASTWPIEADDIRDQNNELKMKIDSLHDKMRQLENDKRNLERKIGRSRSFERGDKSSSRIDLGGGGDSSETENRELRAKIRQLEIELADKEAELARVKSQLQQYRISERSSDIDRYKTGQIHAERLLEAREQSHRQQVLRLENQIKLLRDQLNQEVKMRQRYLMKSARAGREVQELHAALGTSLRKIERDGVDAGLLESETRRLDTTLSAASPIPLPPPR